MARAATIKKVMIMILFMLTDMIYNYIMNRNYSIDKSYNFYIIISNK